MAFRDTWLNTQSFSLSRACVALRDDLATISPTRGFYYTAWFDCNYARPPDGVRPARRHVATVTGSRRFVFSDRTNWYKVKPGCYYSWKVFYHVHVSWRREMVALYLSKWLTASTRSWLVWCSGLVFQYGFQYGCVTYAMQADRICRIVGVSWIYRNSTDSLVTFLLPSNVDRHNRWASLPNVLPNVFGMNIFDSYQISTLSWITKIQALAPVIYF